jgi:tetratricopeptide (TPR) repeat protein
MGILGFLSFTALLVFLFIEMIKIYRANRNIYFYEIVLCSAIAFLGHSIFDGNYLMPFAAVSMLILTGLALNPGLEVQPGGMNIKPYAIAAGVVVLAGAVFLLWNRSTFSAGITSFQEQDFKKSAAWFEKSRQVDRRNPIGYIYHGLLAAHLAENSQPEYLDIAIADFQTALNLDPNWAVTHANLAALYLTAGETDLAKSFFEKSQQLSPDWYVPKLNLGLIFEIENDLQRARDNYFSALSAYTEISGSSFWRTNGIREDVLKAWLNLNPKKEYSLEDYSSVMAQASPMPMIELGGELVERNYELAHKLLLRSKLVYPPYPYIDVERVWLEAELHAEQGNLLKAVSAGKSVLASLRRDGLFGPGSAGLSLYYDGLYRAPVLPVEFVPQLITITLPGKWEQRLYQLAGWEMKNGDQAECLNTIETLLRYAPEYLTVNQVSPPCKAE